MGIVILISHIKKCMNYGQSQAKLSVAIAAPFRQVGPAFRRQGWDKLSRPYGRPGCSVERSRCVLGGCGSEIRSVDLKEKEGASPCGMGSTLVSRHGQGMAQWDSNFLNLLMTLHVVWHVYMVSSLTFTFLFFFFFNFNISNIIRIRVKYKVIFLRFGLMSTKYKSF